MNQYSILKRASKESPAAFPEVHLRSFMALWLPATVILMSVTAVLAVLARQSAQFVPYATGVVWGVPFACTASFLIGCTHMLFQTYPAVQARAHSKALLRLIYGCTAMFFGILAIVPANMFLTWTGTWPVAGWTRTFATVTAINFDCPSLTTGAAAVNTACAFYMTVQYAAQQGAHSTTESFDTPDQSSRPWMGEHIPIEYDPHNPSNAHDLAAQGNLGGQFLIALIVITSLEAFSGGLLGLILLRRARIPHPPTSTSSAVPSPSSPYHQQWLKKTIGLENPNAETVFSLLHSFNASGGTPEDAGFTFASSPEEQDAWNRAFPDEQPLILRACNEFQHLQTLMHEHPKTMSDSQLSDPGRWRLMLKGEVGSAPVHVWSWTPWDEGLVLNVMTPTPTSHAGIYFDFV